MNPHKSDSLFPNVAIGGQWAEADALARSMVAEKPDAIAYVHPFDGQVSLFRLFLDCGNRNYPTNFFIGY
jgi:hypothetical protein